MNFEHAVMTTGYVGIAPRRTVPVKNGVFTVPEYLPDYTEICAAVEDAGHTPITGAAPTPTETQEYPTDNDSGTAEAEDEDLQDAEYKQLQQKAKEYADIPGNLPKDELAKALEAKQKVMEA